MPSPQVNKRGFMSNRQLTSLQTKKSVLKNVLFSVIFASLRSNISAPRQNFKNLLGNLRDIKIRNLTAKCELCSFNTEGAFQMDGHTNRWTDRRTLKNNSTLVLLFK